jgi:heme exporter protein C
MTAIDRSVGRFVSFAGRALPWLAGATLLAFGLGLTASLAAPDDYWQGATVQIMFLHVPSCPYRKPKTAGEQLRIG